MDFCTFVKWPLGRFYKGNSVTIPMFKKHISFIININHNKHSFHQAKQLIYYIHICTQYIYLHSCVCVCVSPFTIINQITPAKLSQLPFNSRPLFHFIASVHRARLSSPQLARSRSQLLK